MAHRGLDFLDARFHLVSSPQTWELMKFILLNDASRWTFSCPNFDVVPRALGDFDGVC